MRTKSVGNTNAKKHGLSYLKSYVTWDKMICRCTKKNEQGYSNYGGRGIKICDKWMKMDGFFDDMGERPDGMSLDRIDNNKGYFKENCRWATQKQQHRNKRSNRIITIDGESKCIAEWAEDKRCKVSKRIIGGRLERKWIPSLAVFAPPSNRQVGRKATRNEAL